MFYTLLAGMGALMVISLALNPDKHIIRKDKIELHRLVTIWLNATNSISEQHKADLICLFL
jgi:hypothetical protein